MKYLANLLYVLCLLLSTSNHSLAQQTGDLSFSYPGGVVELILPKNSNVLPSVQYGIREPVIIEQFDHWRVIIGLDINTLPGDYLAYIKYPDSGSPAYSIKFTVRQKSYPITEVDSELQSNINIQHEKLSDLDFSNTEQPIFPLKLPIAGQWDDAFANQEFNIRLEAEQQDIISQNFVSLTTTEIATVSSPAKAIVSRIILSDESSPLATIYLDHGRGLYSIISGVSDLSVSTGDGILAGAVIGKLSQDEKNSSPKVLKWQCMINGVYVNPLILTQL